MDDIIFDYEEAMMREISEGESDTLAFWRDPMEDDDFVKILASFANSKGGRILFGVTPTGGIEGIDDYILFRVRDRIRDSVHNLCRPNNLSIPDLYVVSLGDKNIIVAEVRPKRDRPFYVEVIGIDGGIYVREGTETVEINPFNYSMPRALWRFVMQ